MVPEVKRLVKSFINKVPWMRHGYISARALIIKKRLEKEIKGKDFEIQVVGFEEAWEKSKNVQLRCPSHRFIFIGNSLHIPVKCLYIIDKSTKQEYFIPFILDGHSCFVVINQIVLPSEIFFKAIYELMRRYNVKEMKTQRTYNKIKKIPFLQQEKIESYEIEFTSSFDEYFSSLGKKTRFNTKYYFQKIEKDLKPDFKVFKEGETDIWEFKHFLKLVNEAYPQNPWGKVMDIFEDFKKYIYTFVTYVDGQPSAFNIYFRWGKTMILVGNIFDRKYSKYSFGFIHTFRSIKEIFNLGFKKVILGPWPQGYKNRLAKPVEMYIYSF